MSRRIFDDNCPGCRPAIVDTRTGKVLPDSAPEMSAALAVWGRASPREREAFHAVCCLNSRDAADLGPAAALVERIKQALPST